MQERCFPSNVVLIDFELFEISQIENIYHTIVELQTDTLRESDRLWCSVRF